MILKIWYHISLIFHDDHAYTRVGSHLCSGDTLKLLSWNIDGLDEGDLKERTEYACQVILLKRPHIVFLQEVVDASWGPVIVSKLSRCYSCYCAPSPPQHYYNAILVLKDASLVSIAESGLIVHDFRSRMGRHLLQLSIQFSGVEVTVMTSHLESLKDHGEERVRQLKIAFEKMAELQKAGKISLFGGDLNIREAELKKAKVPEKIIDVWEACGKQKEHQYSWDLTENDNLHWPHPYRPKARYDRVYLSPGDGALQPMNFELIGKMRLTQCGRFVSRHWGLWMEFKVHKWTRSIGSCVI